MSLKATLLKPIVVNKLTRSLTGNIQDLRRLTKHKKIPTKSPGLQQFLKSLNRDIDENKGIALLCARLGRLSSRKNKRKLIENAIWNWGVVGNARRLHLRAKGVWAPNFVVLSPTMRCNLKCTGCYSGLYSKEGELSEAEVDRLLAEMRSFGSNLGVFTGGEPYLLKDMLLRMFRKYRDMFFITYTNGTLLDEPTVREMGRLGNVMPAISVEGYEAETDRRRGPGTHRKILEAMARLKREGVIFGISVTYTRENVDTVTKDEFIEYYIDRGALYGWYFMFVPVGKDPILELVPTPEQRLYCGRRVIALRKKYPILLADFWNDGPAAAGCIAGGRQYLHIVNSGRVEPCVFAHFGVDNVREKTILEAANSPFFQAIRAKIPYNDNANLMRPCMIIDNPEVLRELVDTYMVPQGHPHSEDIIHDPKVVEWIDDFAERYRALVDPIWEKEINDPKSRWYKEGKEYKNLLRMRSATPEGKVNGSRDAGTAEIDRRKVEEPVRI